MIKVEIQTVAVSNHSIKGDELLTKDDNYLIPFNIDESEVVEIEHLPNVGDFITYRLKEYMVEAVLHITARPNSSEKASTTLLVSQQFV